MKILIHDFRWLKQNSVSTLEQNGIVNEQIKKPLKMDDSTQQTLRSFLQTSHKEMDRKYDACKLYIIITNHK